MRRKYNKDTLVQLIEVKTHFANTSNDSIPSDSTQEGLEVDYFEPFFTKSIKLCQHTVPSTSKYPYKSAELKHHEFNMQKRWYVEYYAWNVKTEKLQRCRLFEPLNRIKKLSERINTGEMMARIINGKLAAGKVLGKDELEQQVQNFQPAKLTLLNTIDYVIEQKKADGFRKNYYRTFTTLKTNLEAWLTFNAQPDFPIKQFSEKDARNFFLYLRDEKDLANKSINNIMANLGTALKFLQKYSGSVIWRSDPLRNVTVLKVVSQKHPAYSDDQVALIKTHINKLEGIEYKQLEFFIAFIYYLLARPNEICNIRIADLDLIQNRVFIPGSISKNGKDEYVEIPPQLKSLIVASGVLKFAPEFYVFGLAGVPSSKPCYTKYFWKLHTEVIEQTGLKKVNQRFSVYSYKHSGAISLYKATKDIKLVQRQCRHQTLEQTNTYLRDLGLLSDYNQLTKWKGAV